MASSTNTGPKCNGWLWVQRLLLKLAVAAPAWPHYSAAMPSPVQRKAVVSLITDHRALWLKLALATGLVAVGLLLPLAGSPVFRDGDANRVTGASLFDPGLRIWFGLWVVAELGRLVALQFAQANKQLATPVNPFNNILFVMTLIATATSAYFMFEQMRIALSAANLLLIWSSQLLYVSSAAAGVALFFALGMWLNRLSQGFGFWIMVGLTLLWWTIAAWRDALTMLRAGALLPSQLVVAFAIAACAAMAFGVSHVLLRAGRSPERAHLFVLPWFIANVLVVPLVAVIRPVFPSALAQSVAFVVTVLGLMVVSVTALAWRRLVSTTVLLTLIGVSLAYLALAYALQTLFDAYVLFNESLIALAIIAAGRLSALLRDKSISTATRDSFQRGSAAP